MQCYLRGHWEWHRIRKRIHLNPFEMPLLALSISFFLEVTEYIFWACFIGNSVLYLLILYVYVYIYILMYFLSIDISLLCMWYFAFL